MSPRRASPLALEFILLDLVDQKPRHGYEIGKELARLEGIGLVWRLNQSQLYALLDKLETQGYLDGQVLPGENRPDRRELRLSAAGKTLLEEWADQPVESQRFMRQEFMAKLHHVFRMDPGMRTRRLIDRQKANCLRWETTLLLEMENTLAGREFTCAVLDYRFRQVRATREWLEQLPEIFNDEGGDTTTKN
jgi:PadR family transcriptional regulator, regulatory protein AphA